MQQSNNNFHVIKLCKLVDAGFSLRYKCFIYNQWIIEWLKKLNKYF